MLDRTVESITKTYLLHPASFLMSLDFSVDGKLPVYNYLNLETFNLLIDTVSYTF